MPTVLERLPHGARVTIIRLRSLGDCVLTAPALQILNTYRPDLRVSIVVEDRFRAVFEGNPAVLSIGLKPAGLRPDLLLNLHGGTRSAALAIATRAPIRAGFGHFRWSAFYNVRIPRAQQIFGENRTFHTAEHLASAMFFLGVPFCEIPRARLFAAPPHRGRPYAIFHPFASRPDKVWPAERFIALANEIRSDVEPVFIAGPGDDTTPFTSFETMKDAPLREVISRIAGSTLFIGNDSGPAHIAAAYGIPVVVFFGPSDPRIWGPWRTPCRVLTDPTGISAIKVSDALAALGELKVSA